MNDQELETIGEQVNEDLPKPAETGAEVALPDKKPVRKERNTVRVKGSPDVPLIISILVLVGFGLAMV